MSVYDIQGNPINICYDFRENPLSQVYDINGDSVGDFVVLKVMTYNVGQWYIGTTAKVPTASKENYYTIHNSAFSNHHPDILCLQEALSTWCDDGSLTADLLSPYFDNSENSRPTTVYQGHYICTNGYPISNYTVHNFSVNKGNYPSFETCQIVVDGKTINIVNTHNDFNDSYAPTETAELLEAIQDMEYFILCGDFNTSSTAEGDAEYNAYIKPYLDAGYNVGNSHGNTWIQTYFSTSSPTGGGAITDNIITSPNIFISSIYADTTKLTDDVADKIDHIPLIADLVIT